MKRHRWALVVALLVIILSCTPEPVPEELLPLKADWRIEIPDGEVDSGLDNEWVMYKWVIITSFPGYSDIEVDAVYGMDSFCWYIEGYDVCEKAKFYGGLVADLPAELQREGYEWFVCQAQYFKVAEDFYSYEKLIWWFFNFTRDDEVKGIVESETGEWIAFYGKK